MDEVYDILRVIRRAEELRPQFAFVFSMLRPIRQPGIETINADRLMRLYFDPDVFEVWELDTAAAMVILQVEHYYRNHPKRQGARKQVLWDYAALIAVTCSLEAESLSLPDNIATPSTFKLPDGKTAEWYYIQLRNRCAKRAADLHRMATEALGKDPAQFGSASSAELKSWEQPEDDGSGAIDYLLALQQERQIRNLPTTPGKGSRQDDRTPVSEADSSIDWRVRFNGLLGSAVSTRPGCADYSYLMPDPDLGMHPGLVLPGLAGRTVNIAVVIDTSSSMHEARLAKAIAETGAIIKSQDVGEGIYVYSCDTVPHTAKQVYHRNQIALVGGGGTDLGPGIRTASLRQPRPDAIVVITDGDTPWPAQGPLGIRVIVVLVGRTNNIPKWVHATIDVPMED